MIRRMRRERNKEWGIISTLGLIPTAQSDISDHLSLAYCLLTDPQ